MKSWLAKIAILTLFTFIPFGINAQQKAGGDTTATATQADAAADSLTDAMAADSMDDAALADGQDLQPEHQTFYKSLKTKFIEGNAGFMSFVALALVLGLAFCIERIIYLSLSEINAKKFMKDLDAKIAAGDIDGGKDLCRRLIRLLASVVPIAFHSVVSRRIMTGGHYNTASGFQMPNSKGKHRRRSRSGIQINMDSLFGQCSCTDFREQAGIVPRVVRNGAGIRKRSLLDVLTVGQCGASYCIYVHAIRSGAHDAAESGSSEGQIVAETRFNFCAVPGNSL